LHTANAVILSSEAFGPGGFFVRSFVTTNSFKSKEILGCSDYLFLK
jgi:hypothetical protein